MSAVTSKTDLAQLIANLDVERQGTAMQSGNAAACIVALRKLQELQAREKEALAMQGPSVKHSANFATLAAEISRVQKLAGTRNRLTLTDKSSTAEPARKRKTVGRTRDR